MRGGKRSQIARLGAGVRKEGIVVVEVGPGHAKYPVHKAFLTHYSEYFRKALRVPSLGAMERKIVLEDVEPNIFNVFLMWLYTQKIPITDQEWLQTIEFGAHESKGGEADLARVKAIVFGNKYAAPSFGKAINNQFVDQNSYCETAIWYSVITYAFRHLSQDAVLLGFLVEMQCRYYKEEYDERCEEERELQHQLPYDFLLRVMLKHTKMRCLGGADQLDQCSFHIHSSDKEREECKQRSAPDFGDDSSDDADSDEET